jgi:peroxiredoxin Q/BCP
LQTKFIEKENLVFPLLADPEGKVTKAYDALNPKNKLAKRTTFIINKEGNIAKIFPNVAKAGDHPEEVLQYVKKNLAK